MSGPMPSRDRRAILIGLAILVPSLAWVWGVRPARAALADMQDRIVSEREALAREKAAVAAATTQPARQRVADSAMKAAASRAFDGANDVAAGAALVTYVGEVAARTHVWLGSATTRPAPTGRGTTTPVTNGLRPLRVELRGESDFKGVLEFLDALERGGKVVVVERLDVARALRAGDDSRETLSVSATVVGYALPAKPSSAVPRESAGGTP